jgi:hypothetical protein
MPMTATDLESLRQKDAAYLERWRRSGGETTKYTCRHCRHKIVTPKPAMEDVASKGYWDSLKTCTGCGGLNFVLVYPDGTTVVNPE